MAGNIKGLTIEVGGNTTKLTQALKEPQKETMTLRSKLKDVDSALRFDTKNVDLLNQKQRLLAKTIDSTEHELTLLKQAQMEYEDSGKDIDGAEYVALENKIKITERALENLRSQQSNFSGELQAMGVKVGEFGQKTEDLGKKFMPVTAGVAAVGTAATAAWSELGEAYDGIAAGTGATGDALMDLQKSFDNVYGNFPADSASVGTAIADLNTRFGFTGEQLEDCSGQFLKFAQINGKDVSSAIALVSRAMGDAGVESSEYASVLDALTSASQASGLSVDKLAESITKYGAPMRALGFEMEDSIALFAQWEKAGVNTEIAFSGMKKAISNWGKEGKNAKEEFQKTLKAIESAPTIADATSMAIEAFGSKAGPDLADAIKGGRFSVEEMTKAIEKSGGIVDQTFNDMLDPADSITVAMNNLKLAGAELGGAIQSALAPMLEKLAELCRNLANWFKGLSDSQKEAVVIFAGLAAAIGPVLYVFGGLCKHLESAIKYFGNTTTVGGKLVASLKGFAAAGSISVGAIAGIASAVALVGGAFATLWNSNEEFRNRMVAIWEEIVGKVQAFCQGITDRINSLGFSFGDITEVIKAVWTEFCNFLAPVFEGVWEQISTIVTYALDTVLGIVSTFTAAFNGDWDGFWQGIQDVWNACWTYINDTVQNILDTVMAVVSEFLSWFGIEWTPNFEAVNAAWQEIWGSIGNFIDEIINMIEELVAAFIALFNGDWDGFCSHVSEAWNTLWNAVKQFASDIWNAIKSNFQNIWNAIKQQYDNITRTISQTTTNIWNNIKSFLSNTWNGLKNTCSNVWNSIKNAITSPIQSAFSTVQNIFSGIYNTITGKINSARDAVSDAINAIKRFFNFSISWPHIPMPHPYVYPRGWKLSDLLHGSMPSIGIDWYAKAMNSGMILDGPTIFGLNSSGQPMAGGESGPEAIIGVNSLKKLIEGAVEQAAMRKLEQIRRVQEQPVGGSGPEIDYDKLASSLLTAMSGIVIQNTVNIGLRQVLTELLPLIDAGLEKRKNRR